MAAGVVVHDVTGRERNLRRSGLARNSFISRHNLFRGARDVQMSRLFDPGAGGRSLTGCDVAGVPNSEPVVRHRVDGSEAPLQSTLQSKREASQSALEVRMRLYSPNRPLARS